MADDLFHHIFAVPAGKQVPENGVARHGQLEFRVHAAELVAFLQLAIAEQPLVQRLEIRFAPWDQVLFVDFLLERHRNGMPVDAQLVEHIERHKAGVQQGIPGQHGRADIAALRGHARDKIFRALVEVYHLVEIPRGDFFLAAHQPGVFGFWVQRAHVIGDAEAEDGQDFFLRG